jgi:U3 small nucleolar RNA-associated protein MPP10
MGEPSSSHIDSLLERLQSDPEDTALSLLSAVPPPPHTAQAAAKEALQRQLRAVCGELFQRIESLNALQEKISDKKQPEYSSLSGLAQLYTGGDDEDDEPVDAETLFSQVELMNQSLTNKVKRSIRKLTASVEAGSTVRLLDDENISESGGSDDEASHSDEHDGMADRPIGTHQDEGEEEERKRIEARMQRALDDMDDEEEQEEGRASDDFVRGHAADNDETTPKESLVDPVAENMNDGFFDINEMENFADEEEEYLPDEAFGTENPKDGDGEEDKRSFHQKQRDGDFDDNEEQESEDDEAFFVQKESSVRRRRYRDEEEIDALYELYQGGKEQQIDQGEDDDSAMEAVNMTAAELYGKPNMNYYEKYKTKRSIESTTNNDDDSWNEYDFEANGKRETEGWNSGDVDDQRQNDEEDEDSGTVPAISDSEAAIERKISKKGSDKAARLELQTELLEQELLAEKPWQMRGETSGTARPTESLLDSTPEFEVATKQAPLVTVERTMNLEEIIKKRILNEDWDDVVPRELPDVAWNKKRGELPEVSQEKSKLGLGELYEREYMKKALGYDAEAVEKETEEEKVANEIKGLFANLCSKLDALSNYHFAPRPVADEAEVRAVAKPAIAMEEVLPLHFSDARGVAPEEVYGAKRGRDGVLRAESELEQQDRKRLRSANKAARRKARKEKEADEKLISKLQPGLGLNNPYEKRKLREELSVARAQGKITTGEADTTTYRSSGTFFQRMQQEAKQSIDKNQTGVTGDPNRQQRRSNTIKL